MKKFFKSALVIGLLAAVAVCSTACGSSNSNASSSKASGTSSESSSSETSKSSTSLEDYLNSSAMKSSLESMKKSMASSGIDIDLRAEGNKLVYEYKYQEQMDPDSKVLDEGLEKIKATFENIATTVGKALNTDVTVVVRYLNADGSVITEREFTAK